MTDTTKRLTVTDHEDARSEIIAAFAAADALYADEATWDTVEAETAFNHAFVVAEKYGWDPDRDESWVGEFLPWRPTGREILAEGLIRALRSV